MPAPASTAAPHGRARASTYAPLLPLAYLAGTAPSRRRQAHDRRRISLRRYASARTIHHRLCQQPSTRHRVDPRARTRLVASTPRQVILLPPPPPLRLTVPYAGSISPPPPSPPTPPPSPSHRRRARALLERQVRHAQWPSLVWRRRQQPLGRWAMRPVPFLWDAFESGGGCRCVALLMVSGVPQATRFWCQVSRPREKVRRDFAERDVTK